MMLAEVGDAKAQARVLEAAKASTGSAKVGAIAALAAARVGGSEEVLRESLRARDANIQAAAAEAAATLGLTALVPDLERVAKEGEQFGRFVAAVSAMKLGGRGVDAIVEAGLTSPAPDARLLAASALKARGRSTWVEATRPLLQDLDGVTRFKAAELLLSVDRKPAFDVLMAGTVDPNIAVRAEVARILAADPNLDLAQFRRLLRDGAPRVRLEAARALLNRTQPPARRQ
jgi:HEAT repeat protein